MQRAIIVAALVLSSVAPAFATTHYEMTYHDTIRPNGQSRGDAVYQSALDACYSQTGLSRNDKDTSAFKSCMKARGYQWRSTRLVQDPPGKPDNRFIDPDTGMSCYNSGFASICEPPQGTVHYTNKHGLNCTRTGAMSFCSNL
jgi:hypothetical protein